MDSRSFDWASSSGLLLAAGILDLQIALNLYALHLPEIRPENCSSGVVDAVAEMHKYLGQVPAVHSGRTSLKGDSRFGAFTLERNLWVPWRLWVRVHGEHGDFRLLGHDGTILQIGPKQGQVFTFPSTACGLATVGCILRDPEVRLRGRAWIEGQES